MEHSEPQPSFWIFSSQTKIALLWVTTHIHAKDSKYQAVDLFYKIYSIHIRNHVQSRTLWLPNIAHFDSNHKKEVHANICSIFNEIKLFHKPLQFTFHFVKLIFNQLLISMFKHSKNYASVFFHSWVTCNLVFIYKFFKILHFFLFCHKPIAHLSTTNVTWLSVQHAHSKYLIRLFIVVFYRFLFFVSNLKFKHLLFCAFCFPKLLPFFWFLHLGSLHPFYIHMIKSNFFKYFLQTDRQTDNNSSIRQDISHRIDVAF